MGYYIGRRRVSVGSSEVPNGSLREWPDRETGTPPAPDGALWFTEPDDDAIGRIAVSADVTAERKDP